MQSPMVACGTYFPGNMNPVYKSSHGFADRADDFWEIRITVLGGSPAPIEITELYAYLMYSPVMPTLHPSMQTVYAPSDPCLFAQEPLPSQILFTHSCFGVVRGFVTGSGGTGPCSTSFTVEAETVEGDMGIESITSRVGSLADDGYTLSSSSGTLDCASSFLTIDEAARLFDYTHPCRGPPPYFVAFNSPGVLEFSYSLTVCSSSGASHLLSLAHAPGPTAAVSSSAAIGCTQGQSCYSDALIDGDPQRYACTFGEMPTRTLAKRCAGTGCSCASVDSVSCADDFSLLYTFGPVSGVAYELCVDASVADTEAPVGLNTNTVVECGTPPTFVSVPFTDNCAAPSELTIMSSAVAVPPCATPMAPGLIETTTTARDPQGNIGLSVQRIQVVDTQQPVFSPTVPPMASVTCTTGPTQMFVPPTVTASDQCDSSPTLTFSETESFNAATGSRELVWQWTATDQCGWSRMMQQVVTVVDTDYPQFTPPLQDTSVACTAGMDIRDRFPLAVPTVTDTCQPSGQPLVVRLVRNDNVTSAGCEHVGRVLRRWAVEDAAGHETQQAQELEVTDTQPPAIDTGGLPSSLDCSASLPMPGVSDNCSPMAALALSSTVQSRTFPFGPACATRNEMVEFEVEDTCQGISSASRANTVTHSVLYSDTTAPVMTFAGGLMDVTHMCTAAQPLPATVYPTVVDDCSTPVGGGVATFSDVSGVNMLNQIEVVRTWSAQDACGNERTAVHTLTLVDMEAPVLSGIDVRPRYQCDPAKTVPGDYGPSVAGTPSVEDVCAPAGALTATASDSTAQPMDAQCSYIGVISRVWQATDFNGQSGMLEQTITVEDTMAPVIGAVGVLECDGVLADPVFSATDECAPASKLTVTHTVNAQGPLAGAAAMCGSVQREYEVQVTDECSGTVVTETRVVQYVDTTAPSVVGGAVTASAQCMDALDSASLGVVPVLDDVCSAAEVVSEHDENHFTCHRNGTITRRFTIRDACGNEAQHTAEIELVKPPPTLVFSGPSTVMVDCHSPSHPAALGTLDELAWSDPCGDPATTLRFDDVEVPLGPMGPAHVVRTFTVRDSCGQTATAVQTVVVGDFSAPVFSARDPVHTFECTGQPTATAITAPTVYDVCSSVASVTSTRTPLGAVTCSGHADEQVVWNATDVNDNWATRVETVVVVDTAAPSVTWPASASLVCSAARFPTVAEAQAMASATDACAGPLTVVVSDESETQTAAQCGSEATLVRWFEATDPCGHSTRRVQTLTLTDREAPVIDTEQAALRDVEVQCNVEAVPAVPAGLTAQDACDGPVPLVLVEERHVAVCGDARRIEREWRAVDGCGNAATHVQRITVVDTQGPVITWVPAAAVLECSASVDVANTAATGGVMAAHDVCNAPVHVTYTDTTTMSGCGGTRVVERRWVALDTCTGLKSVATQQIDVEDHTPPVFTRQLREVAVECGEATDPAATGVPRASDYTDACSPGSVTVTHSDTFTAVCGGAGEVRRRWEAQDACGLVAWYEQTLSVVDTRPPQLTVPDGRVLTCPADTAPAAVGQATAADVCGDATVSYHDMEVSGCGGTRQVVRVWQATDECGLTTVREQSLSVVDQQAPLFTSFPVSALVECQGDTSPASTGTPTADDTCGSGGAAIAHTDSSAPTDSCGLAQTILRQWSATDACGLVRTRTQQITTVDTTAPVLSTPSDVVVECGAATGPSTTGSASASDVCSAVQDVSIEHTDTRHWSGAEPCGFVTTREWTARDACGLESSGVQRIEEADRTAPVFTHVPPETEVECGGAVSASALSQSATATDVCAAMAGAVGAVQVTATDGAMSGGCGGGTGSLVRRWRAVDGCGNAVEANQTVRVVDRTAPFFTHVPPDVAVECGVQDPESFAVTGQARAQDQCSGAAVAVTASDAVEQTGCQEVRRRRWLAVDACGNEQDAMQLVSVVDTTAPELAVPVAVAYECGVEARPAPSPPAASDHCTAEPAVSFTDTFHGTCVGPTARTVRRWKATDACGLSATRTQEVVEVDTRQPVVNVSAVHTVNVTCHASLAPGEEVPVPEISDACHPTSALTVQHHDTVQRSGFCDGLVTRQWVAQDPCGHEQSAVQSIRVVDTEGPSFAGSVSHVELECDAEAGAAAALAVAEAEAEAAWWSMYGVAANDHCTSNAQLVVSFEDTVLANETECRLVTVQRDWTARDECGNEAWWAQTVNVTDSRAPHVQPFAAEVTVACYEDATPGMGPASPLAFADCSAVSVMYEDVRTSAEVAGCASRELRREWTARDGCGLESRAEQAVVVVDDEAPYAVSVPASRSSLECGVDVVRAVAAEEEGPDGGPVRRVWRSEVQWEVANATAADRCSSVTVREEVVDGVNEDGAGGCAGEWVIERRFTAEDACGNVAEVGVQRLEVEDRTAPVMAVPADAVVECGVDGFPQEAAEASDQCVAAWEVEVTRAVAVVEGGSSCARVHLVTHTARDPCGNTAVAVQRVEVVDTRAPVLVGAEAAAADVPASVACGSADHMRLLERPLAVTASDACDGTRPVRFEQAFAGECSAAGVWTRRWEAADACGHKVAREAAVRVVDGEGPEVVVVTAAVAVECEEWEAQEEWVEVEREQWVAMGMQAEDACDRVAGLEVVGRFRDEATSEVVVCGEKRLSYRRVWVFQDACGSETEAEQTISLAPLNPPTPPPPAQGQGQPQPPPQQPEEQEEQEPGVEGDAPEIGLPGTAAAAAAAAEEEQAAAAGELEAVNNMIEGEQTLMTDAELAMTETVQALCESASGSIGETCRVETMQVPVQKQQTVQVTGSQGQLAATVTVVDVGGGGGGGGAGMLEMTTLTIERPSAMNAVTLLSTQAVQSLVVEVNARNVAGEVIPFEGKAEICLLVDQSVKKDDVCLGFLDEQRMEARCADECPRKRSSRNDTLICGDTEHFTSFAVLFKGSVKGASSGKCGANDTPTAFGSTTADMVVTAVVFCSVVAVAVVFALTARYVPFVKGWLQPDTGNARALAKLRAEREELAREFDESGE